MTQWAGALATNPNNQSSIPQTHLVGGMDFKLTSTRVPRNIDHTRKWVSKCFRCYNYYFHHTVELNKSNYIH